LLVEKRFDTGEVVLNYAEGPSNEPPILLIHGITNNWRVFLPVMPYLTMRYHVYALDLRGHGKSGRVTGRYNLLDYEKDIKTFMERVIKEPTILFGHSLGGMIATMAAADNPNIKALIIGDSPPNYDDSISIDIEKRMSYWRQAKNIASEEKNFDDILQSLKEKRIMWGDVPIEDSILLRNMANNWSRIDPDILSKMVDSKEAIEEMFAGYDTEILFPRLNCPVMLLRGNPKLGGTIKDNQVKKANELIPDLTYVYIPEIGHALFPVGAEPVLSKVTLFLESLR
jgi:pimeloyl-ACP methyl ester carboxylesterase